MRNALTGGLRWGAVAAGLLAESGYCAELSVAPLLKYSADYSSNRRLAFDSSTAPPNGTQGNQFTVGADLVAENERSKLSMQPRFDLWRFFGDSDQENLDTENVFLNLDGSHSLAERFAATLAAKYAYDSILTTEGGSGLAGNGLLNVLSNSRRIERSLTPGLRYLFGERDNLDMSFAYSDVSYDQNATSTYQDYQMRMANGRWTHQLTETDRFFVNLFASQFRAPENSVSGGNKSNNYGINFGYTGQFWEHWSGTVGAGAQYTESQFRETLPGSCPPGASQVPSCNRFRQREQSDLGALVNMELVRDFETGRASLAYSRSIGPTGFGSQQTVDVVELHTERQLSERWRGNLDFAYSSADYSNPTSGGFASRTFFNAGGHLDYRLYQYISLSGGYYYRTQEYGESGASGGDRVADMHMVMLSIGYSGEKFTFYR